MSRTIGDSHKRFLQTIMSNGIISASQAVALHKHCCETHGDRLDDFINVINAQLQPFFTSGKAFKKEMTTTSVIQVNVTETDITRMASDYADKELELFRKTVNVYSQQIIYQHCPLIFFLCQMCETPACGIKMHLPCVSRYFRARSDPRCPACNDFWPHEIPGERFFFNIAPLI
uniref:Non-structural maintenance of chromosomes element 1 homolog n=1 Tax=Sinocyclocheilus rhinocerous TaxID=307959 RepID=A0A673MR71_9TELE